MLIIESLNNLCDLFSFVTCEYYGNHTVRNVSVIDCCGVFSFSQLLPVSY